MNILTTIIKWSIKHIANQSFDELKNYQTLLKSSPQMILNRLSLLLIEVIEEYQTIQKVIPLLIALIIFGIVALLLLCGGIAFALYNYAHVNILGIIIALLFFFTIILWFLIQKIKGIFANKGHFLQDTLNELEQDRELVSMLMGDEKQRHHE